MEIIKPKYETAIINMASGATNADVTLDIPKGDHVSVGAQITGRDKPIRLSIDQNGTEIQPKLSSDWYDGKQGSIKERLLPLAYEGGTKWKIKASTSSALGSAAEIEVVFLIENPQN